MKRALLMAGALMISGALAAAPAAKPNDEAKVRSRLADFTTAFNGGDANAIAAFWSEDGDLINPAGRYAKGRADVAKVIGDDLATILKGRTNAFDVKDVRFLAPGVAVVNATHIATASAPDVQPPSVNVPVTVVMQKAKDGAWNIAAARPMIPYTPPPPPKPEPVVGKLDGTEWLIGAMGDKKSDSLLFGTNRFASSAAVPEGFLSSSYKADMKGDHVVWSALQVNAKGEKIEWSGESAGPVMTGQSVFTKKNGKQEKKDFTAQRVN